MGRDIEKLHPELQVIAKLFLQKCKEKGLPVVISQTFRTKQEQDALYAKGRTDMSSGIVTRAKYPESPHCWGVAFDFCRNVSGKEFDDSDGFFKKCGQVGKSLGLTWGGDWVDFADKPHLELKKYMPNSSVKWLKTEYGTVDKFVLSWAVKNNIIVQGGKEEIKLPETKVVEQWKIDCEKWLRDEGISSSRHDPTEIVDFGAMGAIIKNFIKVYGLEKK